MDNLNLNNDRGERNVWQESARPLVDRLGALGTNRTFAVAGGAVLAALGLRRRGLMGGLLTAVGGALVYRGLNGPDDLTRARAWSAQTLRERGWTATDHTDDAAKESFPASDPPSR